MVRSSVRTLASVLALIGGAIAIHGIAPASAAAPRGVAQGCTPAGAANTLIPTAVSTPGTVQRETIALTGVSGGQFTLTFAGQATAPLAYGAAASTVEAALDGLAAIGAAGGVAVSGSGTAADPYAIVFVQVGPRPAIDVDTSALTPTPAQPGASLSVTQTAPGRSPTTAASITATQTNPGSAPQSAATLSVTTPTPGSAGPPAVNQVNDVAISGATGGSFTLTVNGSTTAPLAVSASAAAVQAMLEVLPTVSPGNVTVSGAGTTANPSVLTFQGALAGVPVAVSGNGANLLPQTPGATSTDQIAVANATGGSFTLTFNGQTTIALAYNANAAAVQAALNALSSIGGAGLAVSVSGAGTPADPWVITFSTVGPEPAITATGSLLPTTSAPGSPATAQVVLTGATGGTFTLSVDGQSTSPLPFNATPAQIVTALDALATVGGVGGSATVTGSGSAANPWIVTLGGTEATGPHGIGGAGTGLLPLPTPAGTPTAAITVTTGVAATISVTSAIAPVQPVACANVVLPTSLARGCTGLMTPADLPANTSAAQLLALISPASAVAGLWTVDPGTGAARALYFAAPGAPIDVATVGPGETLIVCLTAPAAIAW